MFHIRSLNNNSGFGGLEVACWPLVPKWSRGSWPLVPKFAGSNPTEAVGFLRVNKKSSARRGGHRCLSVVIVVCCQVQVSVTS